MAKHWIQNASKRMAKKGTKGSFTRIAGRIESKHPSVGSTHEAAEYVMDHKGKFAPSTRKKANFARNVT